MRIPGAAAAGQGFSSGGLAGGVSKNGERSAKKGNERGNVTVSRKGGTGQRKTFRISRREGRVVVNIG